MAGMYDGVNKVFLLQHRRGMEIEGFADEMALCEALLYRTTSDLDGDARVAAVREVAGRVCAQIAREAEDAIDWEPAADWEG